MKIGFQLSACCCTFAFQWLDCWRFHGPWPPNYSQVKFVASHIQFHTQWQIFWCSLQFKFIGNFHFFIACQFQYLNFCENSLPAGIYRNFWVELMRYSTSLLAYRFLHFSLHCFSYLKRTEKSWAKLRIISEVKVPKNQPDRKNQQVVSQNKHFRPLTSRRKWWTVPKMSKLHSQFQKMSNTHKFSA